MSFFINRSKASGLSEKKINNWARIIFLIGFIFINFLTLGAYSIVFIHLGPTLPEFLNEAALQARLFNKNTDIYVVANRIALAQADLWALQHLQVKIVPIESLNKSKEHTMFEKRSIHNTKFRQGFWRFTIERFMVLDEFMQYYQLKDVIHLESDTMLYRDVSELMPFFKSLYNGIGGVFINDHLCIPCFLYIKNAKVMKYLARYIARTAGAGKNDMTTLAVFRARHTYLMDVLPIVFDRYVARFGLQSIKGDETKNPAVYYKNIDAFNSVFDGNACGQYLGGIDPKNGFSRPGFINANGLINPSLLHYKWEKDDQGRKVPYMILGNKKYRINNLHIHSKDLNKFLSIPKNIDSKESLAEVDRLRYIADYAVEQKFCYFDPRALCKGNSIFVDNDSIDFFFKKIFPFINVKIVLLLQKKSDTIREQYKTFFQNLG